jgi:hypothetical protein
MKKVGIFLLILFVIGAIGSLFDEPETTETVGKTSDSSSSPSLPRTTYPPQTTTTISEVDFNAALSKSTMKVDEVEGTTFYRAKTSPTYTNRNGFFLYVGSTPNVKPWYRFRIQYYGDNWLFIDSYTINVDGVKYNINPSYGEVERDNDSKVWEWYDINPTASDINMLENISRSQKTIVRMNGSQYYKDFEISPEQKNALQTMFTVHQGLLTR